MLTVMTQMGALIVAGVVWRALRPGGLDADTARQVLTTLVYYLLLPALVLQVLWTAPLGLDSIRIALVAGLTVLAMIAVTLLACRLCAVERAAMGAMLLAAAWPNATYLGLPVLDSLFGEAGRAVAIQYDLFACLPLLLTLGYCWRGTTGIPRRCGCMAAGTPCAGWRRCLRSGLRWRGSA